MDRVRAQKTRLDEAGESNIDDEDIFGEDEYMESDEAYRHKEEPSMMCLL